MLELSKEININKVILFGSYAKGTNHEDSDIDLAIFSDDFSNMERIEALKFLLLKASDLTVDLQPQPFTLADLEDEDNWLANIADIPCYELQCGYEITALKYDGEKLIGDYDIGYIGA